MATTTAAATRTDLLVRNSTTDTGQIPASGPANGSTDLIPTGSMPLADPNVLVADMSKTWGNNDISVGDDVYLYGRGINLAPGAASGTLHLYYAPAALLQWPSRWSKNEIPLNDGSLGSPVSATATGLSFVTKAPFYWKDVPSPAPSDHYCLIGRTVTTRNPNPIPSVLEIADFAAYIANNRGMSWRNMHTITDPHAPELSVDVNYQQGTTAAAVYVQIICKDIPVGCQVAFSCGTPGPAPLINLAQTTITNSAQVLGLATTIPAGFSSNITYQLWSNGHTLPAGAKLTLQVLYVPTTELDLGDLGGDLTADFGVAPEDMHDEHREQLGIGPVRAICLGSFSSVVPVPANA